MISRQPDGCGLRRNSRTSQWIGDMQPADAGDRLTEAYQLLAVELVNSAEVVDDFSYRFVSFRMALVVCELEVLDDRSIFVGALCCSEIHAYGYSMYL